MIVSHEHRFIFVRTEKTAGSSIHTALAEFCSPSDLIVGGGAKGGRSRRGEDRAGRPPWVRYLPGRSGAIRRMFPQYFGLHTHATLAQVRASVDRKVFDSYFKFAVERNPWDRQVSLYYHRKHKAGTEDSLDFDRDMRSLWYRTLHYTRMHNWEIYTIDGKLAVDRVIRFENLTEELREVLTTLGLPGEIDLPFLRSGLRADARDYRQFYSDKTRKLVGKWYRNEIEAFGYSF